MTLKVQSTASDHHKLTIVKVVTTNSTLLQTHLFPYWPPN